MENYINQTDIPYEEDILRNQYSLKSWLRYIDFKAGSNYRIQYTIYERALKQLPFSYKLWYNYLKLQRNNAKKFPISDLRYEEANNNHERALNYMHKMPRIWMDYLSFLSHQGYVTRFRRTFNRCLCSLPTTQHRKVWQVALDFIWEEGWQGAQETKLRMYRRFMELAPEEAEDFVDYLIGQRRFDEAAGKLVDILNDDKFGSKYSKSKFELWQKLCDVITKNPTASGTGTVETALNVDAIVRQGISRYKDQVGVLWAALADFYIRSNNLEHARDIYEEAMLSVDTVADFKLIFSAYDDFNKAIIRRKLVLLQEGEGCSSREELEVELSMDMEVTEHLLNRRPLLLNSVVLKQNPHNVANWLERVKLQESQGPGTQLRTFSEAIEAISVSEATGGSLSQIYMEMAALYERLGRVEDSRAVFDRGCKREFAKVTDLADLVCARAEMELRLGDCGGAVEILRAAVAVPGSSGTSAVNYHDESRSVGERLHKCLRLWCFLIDLSESVSGPGDTEAVVRLYEAPLELRIATPQLVLQHAAFLEARGYHERAFSVYQKGVSVFKWPPVYDIWLTYLGRFMGRYEGTQSERTGELFRQCVAECPEEHCLEFYLLYGDFVEKHGLARKALAVYGEAARRVAPGERHDMFVLYLEKVRRHCGVAATRAVFEEALEVLGDVDSRRMGVRWAEMETALGEVDRARELYGYSAQFCDPRVTEESFWAKWLEFESSYGNGDTVGNYNLVKRSVEAKYNTRQSLVHVHLGGAVGGAVSEDSMQTLESNVQKLAKPVAFVSGGVSGGTLAVRTVTEDNPEAMEVDMEEEEQQEEEEDDDMPEELPIPAAIFGNLK